MKKGFLIISLLLIVFLQSCVIGYDTIFYITNEEIIKVNRDSGGSYSVKLYIDEFLKENPQLLKDQPPAFFDLMKIDTTISFDNSTINSSKTLSEQEKLMFTGGNLRVNLNLSEYRGYVIVNLFYRNISQLDFARKHIAEFIENNIEYGMYLPFLKTDMAEQKSFNYKVENYNEQNVPLSTEALNPVGQSFQLSVFPGTITNLFDNPQLLKRSLASDKMLQQISKNPGLKRIILKMTLILPGEIKNYTGNVESINQDKTAITFKSTLEDVLTNSKSFEYSVFY